LKRTMYRTVGIMLVALVSHGAAFSFAGIGMGRVAPKPLNLNMMAAPGKKEVLIVGGTRFSGLYLWEELHKRGHSVTLFNRGKTALKKLPGESDYQFEQRKRDTKFIQGDRKDTADMKAKLGRHGFDVVYDMGGSEPLSLSLSLSLSLDTHIVFIYVCI
jgi:2'-hydroxyisoflavone reductase